jgi:hypothetical protein
VDVSLMVVFWLRQGGLRLRLHRLVVILSILAELGKVTELTTVMASVRYYTAYL